MVALALLGAASCSDTDDGVPTPTAGTTSTAADGGEDGSSELAGGGGETARTPGDPPEIPETCTDDFDCDDGAYCNGRELCIPKFAGADIRICVRALQTPCGNAACDETTNLCSCQDKLADFDRDGFLVPGCVSPGELADCDDADDQRNPNGTETCDASIEDSATRDEDCDDSTIGPDADGDGFVEEGCSNDLRLQPTSLALGVLTNRGQDCDDRSARNHPGAEERCDNKDNDCDGDVDEVGTPTPDAHKFYRDEDGDQYGVTDDFILTKCPNPPDGYAFLHGDCEDDDRLVSPAREERCNGKDDDCDEDRTIDKPYEEGDLLFDEPFDGVTTFTCEGEDGWAVAECPADRDDCNDNYRDACETRLTTLCDCRECGNTCSFSCGEAGCEEIAAVSTGARHTCALVRAPTTDGSPPPGGSVACWGENSAGQLGNDSLREALVPGKISDLSGVTAIASGSYHTCAIANERILCWGANQGGELGALDARQSIPFPIEIRPLGLTFRATKLAAGTAHTCTVYVGGELACWGRNDYGQLGDRAGGVGTFSSAPVRVLRGTPNGPANIIDAVLIAAGDRHSCTVTGSGVECWGDNSWAQLGVEPTEVPSSAVALPVPALTGLAIDEISAAANHTCVRAGGDVYCWGSNYAHELGRKEEREFGLPVRVDLPTNATSITTGTFVACALLETGAIHCWGSNFDGQRGTEDAPPIAPSPIRLDSPTGVFGGYGSHLCATLEDRATWCWGNNRQGQLGTGETSEDPQPTPLQVLALGGAPDCSLP
jgi:alpha-tubulin suppressor-like RCC1 family protein